MYRLLTDVEHTSRYKDISKYIGFPPPYLKVKSTLQIFMHPEYNNNNHYYGL